MAPPELMVELLAIVKVNPVKLVQLPPFVIDMPPAELSVVFPFAITLLPLIAAMPSVMVIAPLSVTVPVPAMIPLPPPLAQLVGPFTVMLFDPERVADPRAVNASEGITTLTVALERFSVPALRFTAPRLVIASGAVMFTVAPLTIVVPVML